MCCCETSENVTVMYAYLHAVKMWKNTQFCHVLHETQVKCNANSEFMSVVDQKRIFSWFHQAKIHCIWINASILCEKGKRNKRRCLLNKMLASDGHCKHNFSSRMYCNSNIFVCNVQSYFFDTLAPFINHSDFWSLCFVKAYACRLHICIWLRARGFCPKCISWHRIPLYDLWSFLFIIHGIFFVDYYFQVFLPFFEFAHVFTNWLFAWNKSESKSHRKKLLKQQHKSTSIKRIRDNENEEFCYV